MKTYKELTEYLAAGRRPDRRRLANNTYCERREGGRLAIRLHQTDVLCFDQDGTITLNSGGWKTNTTKARLNEFSPAEVWQDKGLWTVRLGDNSSPFIDGLQFRDGKFLNAPQANGEEKNLRKRIRQYAEKCVESLPLPMPGAGDCWYCQMREVKTGKPLGEATGNPDHLHSHLEEGYVVPSLVWRAIEAAGCNPQGNGSAWFNEAFGKPWISDGKRQLARFIRKYLYRQFGLVS